MTTERTNTFNCDVDNPNSRRFCDDERPFRQMWKASGSWPLPWDMGLSGVWRVLPGASIGSTYTVTSAIAGVPARESHRGGRPAPLGGPAAGPGSGHPRPGNQSAISRAADSWPSLACTRFSVVTVAKSPRMVPGSASSTFVAPTSFRTSR